MNNKIGSLDSATGESSYGILSMMLKPFIKRQSVSLLSQLFFKNVRMFDFHVSVDKKGEWRFCKWLWKTRETATFYLDMIESSLKPTSSEVQIILTLDSKLTEANRQKLLEFVEQIKSKYNRVIVNSAYVGKTCIYKDYQASQFQKVEVNFFERILMRILKTTKLYEYKKFYLYDFV